MTEQDFDRLWMQHTAPGDNAWDNWRRFARALLAVEREALLAACGLEGVTVADLRRIIEERNRH